MQTMLWPQNPSSVDFSYRNDMFSLGMTIQTLFFPTSIVSRWVLRSKSLISTAMAIWIPRNSGAESWNSPNSETKWASETFRACWMVGGFNMCQHVCWCLLPFFLDDQFDNGLVNHQFSLHLVAQEDVARRALEWGPLWGWAILKGRCYPLEEGSGSDWPQTSTF